MNELDRRRMMLFDGNPHFSPMFVMMLVFGVFFLATIPPVGLVIILLGWNFQRRRMKRNRALKRDIRARALERRQAARQRALLSMAP